MDSRIEDRVLAFVWSIIVLFTAKDISGGQDADKVANLKISVARACARTHAKHVRTDVRALAHSH